MSKGFYRLDHARGRLKLGSVEIPVPKSRAGRIAVGSAFIGGGALGFLPILGFWMVPVGLLVLSHDLSSVRRSRRRMAVWWNRRNAPKNTDAPTSR
ncbi:hypothetical protein ACSV9I_04450 [Rhizobium sp. G187]|uniref:hypothetical protein n=1 Tax=unclassified Rhizobium TaxID=2613769 RepID=UPI0006CD0BB4|nr:hypothetical protein [Rhizobium sp. AAP43]KPF41808.1 hypothetical protein IP76_19975 [Rhizobium sp. AAP43]